MKARQKLELLLGKLKQKAHTHFFQRIHSGAKANIQFAARNVAATTGLITLGGSALYAAFHKPEPAVNIDKFNEMIRDLLDSCKDSTGTRLILNSLLEAINTNNKEVIIERLNNLHDREFKFSRIQFNLLIMLIAAQGKVSILETLISHEHGFEEEAVKSVPCAKKLLEHPARYEIEALVAPYFQYARKQEAGLFSPENLSAALECAEESTRESELELPTPDNELEVSRHLQEYKDHMYDASILTNYANTLIIPAHDPRSGKVFSDFIDHLKKEATDSGKPAVGAGIITSGHVTSFTIQVQLIKGQMKAEILYFDSAANGASCLLLPYNNDEGTGTNNFYNILRDHFPEHLQIFVSAAKVQFISNGCPLYSLFNVTQSNEMAKTFALSPDYLVSEHPLFPYARANIEQKEVRQIYCDQSTDQMLRACVYDEVGIPAPMKVCKSSFYNDGMSAIGYQKQDVQQEGDELAIDDQTGKPVILRYNAQEVLRPELLGLEEEMKHPSFHRPMFFEGIKTTPKQVVDENTITHTGNDKKTGLVVTKSRNNFIVNFAFERGLEIVQKLVNKSQKEVQAIKHRFKECPDLRAQTKNSTESSCKLK